MISVRLVFLSSFLFVACLAYPTKETSVHDDAEEKAGYFEGDMILTPEQISAIKGYNGIRQVVFRWDNKIVPYTISSSYCKSATIYLKSDT